MFHRTGFDYSCLDWDCFRYDIREAAWKNIFNQSGFAATSDVCEWLWKIS